MAQIFHPSTNTISKVSIFGGLALVIALALVLAGLNRSAYVSEIGVARAQPVPFSHKHHVADDGIDCRYCHTSVEKSSFAGVPSTKICMNCHTQIWPDSAALAPVRESFRTGQPIEWTRVYNLPGFVYFDHSIHVRKGVGCVTWRVTTLHMDWCLECHRAPERFVRPREYVFSMDYQPRENQLALGQRLIKEYDIRPSTSCSTCHR